MHGCLMCMYAYISKQERKTIGGSHAWISNVYVCVYKQTSTQDYRGVACMDV